MMPNPNPRAHKDSPLFVRRGQGEGEAEREAIPFPLDYQRPGLRRRPSAREIVLGAICVAVAAVACVLEYRSIDPQAQSQYRSTPARITPFPFKRGGIVRDSCVDTGSGQARELASSIR